MLDPAELKLVVSTLTTRRNWLAKNLDQQDESTQKSTTDTIKLLDSAIKKLLPSKQTAAAPQKTQKPSVQIPKAQKRSRTEKIPIEEAHILVAEDNADSAMLLQGLLEDIGCQNIEVVSTGREAQRAMEKCSPPYDVVLCDWDMPELDGLSAIQAVRSLVKLQNTHFIMVTAVSEAKRIKEAVSNGVHDYIVKPIDFDTLEKKIVAALDGEEAKAAAPVESDSSLLKRG